MSSWKDYFRSLLITRRIMLNMAIFIDRPDINLTKGEIVRLKNTEDYPQIFQAHDVDQEGTTIRISGMFGDVTYKRIGNYWIEIEYNPRDNTDAPANTLTWACV